MIVAVEGLEQIFTKYLSELVFVSCEQIKRGQKTPTSTRLQLYNIYIYIQCFILHPVIEQQTAACFLGFIPGCFGDSKSSATLWRASLRSGASSPYWFMGIRWKSRTVCLRGSAGALFKKKRKKRSEWKSTLRQRQTEGKLIHYSHISRMRWQTCVTCSWRSAGAGKVLY